MSKVLCPTPSAFRSCLQISVKQSIADNIPLFLLFTGEKVSTTGKSWCPDCVKSEPIIFSALESLAEKHILMECIVKRDEYKGNPDYEYRKIPDISLTCVPTLMYWRDGKCVVARLNDSQCQQEDIVKNFIKNIYL